MCTGFNSQDDISLLKDLFFNLNTTSRTDWTNINNEKRHDFKFWSDVTHNLGFDILKSVFSIGSSYFDDYNVTKYHIKSVFGDELCETANYTITLKNEVAFQLLSGMIENRIPGSLRLIVRGNGYTFFENRINQLLVSKSIDTEALCHNLNSLIILFPYLIEYPSVNLSNLCFRFVTSKLWKYMFSYVAINLKKKNDLPNQKLFCKFLELSTHIFYGSRGPGFLKRLHSSSSYYLWNSLIPLVSTRIHKNILFKVITFICDIFVMSFSDGCQEFIPKDVFKTLKHNFKRCYEMFKNEGYTHPDGLTNNDFNSYHTSICMDMLHKLNKIFGSKIKELNNNISTIYEISSLGSSKITIPYSCKSIFESSGFYFEDINYGNNFKSSSTFPRVIPCFNSDCTVVYHIDVPEIHLSRNSDIKFFYCKNCGIPSYCSERCFKEHWQLSHKDMCPYFVSFPTFAKYIQRDEMKILSTLDDSDFKCLEMHPKNSWNLVF